MATLFTSSDHRLSFDWPHDLQDAHENASNADLICRRLQDREAQIQRDTRSGDYKVIADEWHNARRLAVQAHDLWQALEAEFAAALAAYEDKQAREQAEMYADEAAERDAQEGQPDPVAEADAWSDAWAAAHPIHEEDEAKAQRAAERKQRANFNAVADGFAPPYPSEY